MVVTDRPLSTPVLIGRDDLLALGMRRVQNASNGDGQMLFLAGEAGIGKSRLLGSIAREAERQGTRVVRAGAFPRDLEVPGALLLDLAHGLTLGPVEGRPAGRWILRRLRTDDARAGDLHRRRRLLVMEVADRLASLANGDRPAVLALEDLHWVDDLTLEALAHLARRIASLPMLVVCTYRTDELYPRVPMREWRARLLTQRLAEEARLTRLSLEQTGTMANLLLGGSLPAPRRLVEALQARSDGIPLHVEEILGAMTAGMAGVDPDAPGVPDTLTDAVLTRRGDLGRTARRVADAAAIVDRSFDVELLAAVAGETPEKVAAAIDELASRYFLVPAPKLGWWEFRHALIRDALEAAVPGARRRTLHERVARHAAGRPDLGDDGFLSAHFEAAGMPDEAFGHARAAAGRAASLSAHREAHDLFGRAIRCAPVGLPAEVRAELVAASAAEVAATDDNAAAIRAFGEARRILLEDGKPERAAALVPPMVAVSHLLGEGLDARVKMLHVGIAEVGPDGPAGLRARLAAGLSAAYMLDRRLDEAIVHGERAIALATRAGDEATDLNASTTLGAVYLFTGRMGDGWSLLADATTRGRRARNEAEAARAYRMIGSSASVLVEYDRGERWLREGIEYAERTEQWNHRHYMAAHLGHVLWATGAWEESERVTRHALADGRGGITTRITSLHVLGYLAMGRGDWVTAEVTLDEARTLGDEMSELQRFSPALWGLAESALLQGRHTDAIELTDAGHRASVAVRDAAYLFPYLVTGTRARLAAGDLPDAERWVDTVVAELLDRSIPGTLPAIDHARGLLALGRGSTGRAREALAAAREGWRARRRAWEECGVTVDLARCSLRANRPGEAASLLAEAIAGATRMGAEPLLRLAGELDATVRARGVEREPWAPLTAREFEVASLIAEGRTNRAIAEELAITPKTVASHVEHILGRLGAERRTEIAAWVMSVRPGAPSGRR